MLEFLVGVFLEFLLPVLGEIIFSVGIHALAEPFRKAPMPWIAGLGYLIVGASLGMASVFVFPSYFITRPALRFVNLAITPVLAGLLMGAVGELRAWRGKPVLRIDRFLYGYLFALAFGLARFLLAAHQELFGS